MSIPALVTPRGDGTFVVAPGKPIVGKEVGTNEAARILGYRSRSSIFEQVLKHPMASRYLRSRYTVGGGKILIELASLLAFKVAIAEVGK